jgi:hypothetical protein
MKAFIFLFTLTVVAVLFSLVVKTTPFTKELYLNEKILDITRPLDVSIDIEFLKELNPAYEQQ